MADHFFLSYSRIDGQDLARTLADHLVATPPSIPVWLDERELQPGRDWDQQIEEALRTCAGLLFLMTRDSVQPQSECRHEWARALRYKKPIIPLLFDRDAVMPFRLEPRRYLDFTGDHEAALAQLRDHIRWRSSPAGLLQGLKERLYDAERDLPRARDAGRPRIDEDIKELQEQIAAQEQAIADPEGMTRRTTMRIERALEHDVFLSYAREDKTRARELADELHKQGYRVFWDLRIPPGQTWRSYIWKALIASRCVIVVWSEQSVNSDWVLEEAEEGKRRGILIPVFLDEVEPPFGFRSIQGADLTTWRPGGRSDPFEHLLHVVRGKV